MAWAKLVSSGEAVVAGDAWRGGGADCVCLALGMWRGMKGLGFLRVITITCSIPVSPMHGKVAWQACTARLYTDIGYWAGDIALPSYLAYTWWVL